MLTAQNLYLVIDCAFALGILDDLDSAITFTPFAIKVVSSNLLKPLLGRGTVQADTGVIIHFAAAAARDCHLRHPLTIRQPDDRQSNQTGAGRDSVTKVPCWQLRNLGQLWGHIECAKTPSQMRRALTGLRRET